jgi:hypothetical protein
VVSFQITVLKVLAGHPEGRATLAELRRAVAILISSGKDWTDRTKRLATRAPGLDIFSQSLVLRDNLGWQITFAGRTLLAALENPIQMSPGEGQTPDVLATLVLPSPLPQMKQVSLNRRRHRAARRRRPVAA